LGNIVKLRRPPQGLSFWLGVILLALSFAIYPAYPVVPFLPVSALRKGEVAVGLFAVSWGMFFVGSVLVGKKGVAYLKRRYFEWREHQRGRHQT
jgi:prolipoprotein diacylglyceryltransferase